MLRREEDLGHARNLDDQIRVGRKEKVFRFEISVNDLTRVKVFDGGHDLVEVQLRLFFGEFPVLQKWKKLFKNSLIFNWILKRLTLSFKALILE